MKLNIKKTIFLVIAFFAFNTTFAQQELKKVYDETINASEQLDKAIKQASDSNKYVVCQVGGNWCIWCLRFADFIEKDSEISKVIKDNFVYAHINYSRQQKNPEVMKRLGNPGRFGFPVLVILNDKGNVIHIQNSAYLEDGQGYSKEKVLDFFQKWTPQAVNTLR